MRLFQLGSIDQYQIADLLITVVDEKTKVLQYDRDGHCKDAERTLKELESNPEYTETVVEAEIYTRADNARGYAMDVNSDEYPIALDINKTFDEIEKTIQQ